MYELQNNECEVIARNIKYGSDAAMFLNCLGAGYRAYDEVSGVCVYDMDVCADREMAANSYDDAGDMMHTRAKRWQREQARQRRQDQIEEAFKRG